MAMFAQILIVLSVLIFIVGLIKPNWVLFWMKDPNRLIATTIGLFMFMGSVTLFSEIKLQHRKAQVTAENPDNKGHSNESRNELQLSR